MYNFFNEASNLFRILEGNRLEEIPSVVFSGLQSLAIL